MSDSPILFQWRCGIAALLRQTRNTMVQSKPLSKYNMYTIADCRSERALSASQIPSLDNPWAILSPRESLTSDFLTLPLPFLSGQS